jgi:hypothetical protein
MTEWMFTGLADQKYTERGEDVPEDIRDQTVEELAASFDGFILAMAIDPSPLSVSCRTAA